MELGKKVMVLLTAIILQQASTQYSWYNFRKSDLAQVVSSIRHPNNNLGVNDNSILYGKIFESYAIDYIDQSDNGLNIGDIIGVRDTYDGKGGVLEIRQDFLGYPTISVTYPSDMPEEKRATKKEILDKFNQIVTGNYKPHKYSRKDAV